MDEVLEYIEGKFKSHRDWITKMRFEKESLDDMYSKGWSDSLFHILRKFDRLDKGAAE